ncbi:MAG: ComF family protein [Paludibacteraceae bacterium]|nr:ComF family protein [Paludibacteraceae bacterium]
MENLINLLLPQKCIICGKFGDVLCTSCTNNFEPLKTPYCIVCDRTSKSGLTHEKCKIVNKNAPTQVHSAFIYKNAVRDVIKKAKYGGKYFSGLKKLTHLAVNFVNMAEYNYRDYLIVPIPLNVKKFKTRGFNQASIISNIVARELNCKINNNLLTRTVFTAPQFEKNRKERFNSLEGVFSCSDSLEGSKLLIVDDVCTTGATLLQAAKTLYSAGAEDVRCFTLAKSVKRNA